MKTNPIIYKSVKFQVAFFIQELWHPQNDTTTAEVRIKQLTTLPSQKEFKNVKEAKEFIRNLKEIL